MMANRASILGIAALVLTMAAGCKKDKPKPVEDQKPESAPVPSGLSFNDFVPNTAAGDAAESGGSKESDPEGEVKVIEAGAEPRSARKYAFALNKTEKRLIVTEKSITQTVDGKVEGPAQETTKLTIELTPKQNKPTGTVFEAKVSKVEIPGVPAQAAPMIAAMSGLQATFEVSPQGKVGEFTAPESPALRAQPQLAQQILEAVGQSLQLMFVPLPEAPIGAGAKWEVSMARDQDKGARKYTLKDATAEGGTVESSVELSAGRREVPAPAQDGPGGPGAGPAGKAFVEVAGAGQFRQDLRFNATAKGGGELKVDEKLDVPDPKAPGKTQKVVQSTKIKQTIEAVGK